MNVKKKPKTPITKSPRANANGKPRTYVDSIRRRLSKVPGVDAVYVWRDGHRVVHVTSVVQEPSEELYDCLMPQEDLVEKDHPRIPFDFHVRIRQNRSVESAIPPGSRVVFKK